jgi:hypothetical protein
MHDESSEIYICAECRTAACWLGIFMCDQSRGANLIQTTVGVHRATNPPEHADYYTSVYDKTVGR